MNPLFSMLVAFFEALLPDRWRNESTLGWVMVASFIISWGLIILALVLAVRFIARAY